MFRPIATTFLVLLAYCESTPAQTPATTLAFDAASVRVVPFVPGKSRVMKGGPGTSDPERINYSRVPILQILMKAYGVQQDQITGPAWLNDNSAMFDIVATLPPDTSKEQFQQMLRNLLAERFHLTLHHESEIFASYDLVLSNGGPKLKESVPASASEPAASGFRVARDGTVQPRGPGVFNLYSNGAQHYGFRERTMEQFVALLGGMIKQSLAIAGTTVPRVVDKTGLTGTYDFTLNYSCRDIVCGPQRTPPSGANQGAIGALATADSGDPNGIPDLLIAIDKQLGLKLEKTKGEPTDILVVDHADKTPTEN